jgi:predicted aspartyl protease
MPHWIAAGLILAGTTVAAEPQKLDLEVTPTGVIDRTTITEDVAITTDDADRMTVPVSVSGKGPYQFLVDTGAERTVISRELAKLLKLTSGRAAILHSVMGRNDVATVHIPHLKVSSNVISVIDAPALGASNIGADGMLGIDSLRSQRVLFDFKAKTMSITPSAQPI